MASRQHAGTRSLDLGPDHCPSLWGEAGKAGSPLCLSFQFVKC